MNNSLKAVSDSGNDQNPLVSILVPSYNHEQYVLDCLNSIKNLTYPRLELLVSDDCSRDSTFRLAEEWAAAHADRFERVAVVRQENNLGVVGNVQYLFDSAHGEYLALIASDDMFMESAIERRVKILQTTPNLDAVFAKAQSISQSGVVVREQHIHPLKARMLTKLSGRKLMAAFLLLEWPAPGPVLFLRRSAVCESGSVGRIGPPLRVEDVFIYVRLAAKGRLGFADSVVAKYRSTPGSLGGQLSTSKDLINGFVITHEMNKPLLHGFNRIVVNHCISLALLQLNKEKITNYKLHTFLYGTATVFLRIVLYLLCFPLRKSEVCPQ